MTRELSLRNIFATAESWDFTEDENWRVVTPTPTESVLDEHWPEWREECADLDDARLDFAGSDAESDWLGDHYPMMLMLWPLELPYGGDENAVADAMAEAGIACCLIERTHRTDDDTYGIALTGGGMNLSDHLATAYIVAGCVPPIDIIEGLPDPANVDAAMLARIRGATDRLADHLVWKAKDLRERVARIDA